MAATYIEPGATSVMLQVISVDVFEYFQVTFYRPFVVAPGHIKDFLSGMLAGLGGFPDLFFCRTGIDIEKAASGTLDKMESVFNSVRFRFR